MHLPLLRPARDGQDADRGVDRGEAAPAAVVDLRVRARDVRERAGVEPDRDPRHRVTVACGAAPRRGRHLHIEQANLVMIELAPEDQTTELAVDGGRVPLESHELL